MLRQVLSGGRDEMKASVYCLLSSSAIRAVSAAEVGSAAHDFGVAAARARDFTQGVRIDPGAGARVRRIDGDGVDEPCGCAGSLRAPAAACGRSPCRRRQK